MNRRRAGNGRDGGSAAIEAVISVPAFGLFVGMLIVAGRVGIAHQAVDSAASEAARAASIARTAAQARTDATAYADSALAAQSLTCVTSTVSGVPAPAPSSA